MTVQYVGAIQRDVEHAHAGCRRDAVCLCDLARQRPACERTAAQDVAAFGALMRLRQRACRKGTRSEPRTRARLWQQAVAPGQRSRSCRHLALSRRRLGASLPAVTSARSTGPGRHPGFFFSCRLDDPNSSARHCRHRVLGAQRHRTRTVLHATPAHQRSA